MMLILWTDAPAGSRPGSIAMPGSLLDTLRCSILSLFAIGHWDAVNNRFT